MEINLKDKNVVITGGTGILGQRFCEGLASSGANMAIIDLDQEKCDDLAHKLQEEYSVKCIGVATDITKPDQVREMVTTVVEKLGSIDVLHNNAASKGKSLDSFFDSYEDFTLETWQEIMQVNVDGMFLVSQAVGKQMIKQGKGGSIIQTASIYGVVAPDKRIYEGSFYMDRQISSPAVYSASKAAVVGLTKYLSAYWGDKGIRVNTLTPGGVESGQNDEFSRKYSNRVPLGRMAKADEMVGALVFLASDASSYITGQNIIVDGGLTVW